MNLLYDLDNQICVEKINLTNYIGEHIKEIYYIQKMNKHQYLLIMEFGSYNIHSFNEITENDNQIFIFISNTLTVNNYQDINFYFI